MRYRCNACLGEYDDVSPDGVPYAHTCPAVTEARVKRGGNWIAVSLDDVRQADTIAVQRGPNRVEILVSATLAGDVRLDDRQTPRPVGVHRDETALPDPVDARGKPDKNRPIKAPGAGRLAI